MKPPGASRVADPDEYAEGPPPNGPSPRCRMWLERITNGWSRNRRVRQMGYYESAGFFGVYIWEWVNVIYPLLASREGLERERRERQAG